MAAGKNGNGLGELERRLWSAADQLWANSPLRPSEYSTPVLGLIFLRFADNVFTKVEGELKGKATGRRAIGKLDYQAKGVVYIPTAARFSNLLQLPESADLGKHLNEAMKAIEDQNEDLKDVLPKSYQRIDNSVLHELLKIMSSIPLDIPGDAFGKIYEYFLGCFAMKEGQKGGEFFTPPSMVDLIVDIIEPFHGRLLDPASGSGGMFVASARYVSNHRRNPNAEISIFGQELVAETIRLCKMNLAVHGLSGDIRQSNTYYEDVHDCVGKFDFVIANPPFNVSGVDKEKIKDDPRFRFGLPNTDIANYLWIQIFYHALSAKGRAGYVMANSAADARGSELEIRKKLIQSGAVDIIVSVGPNFFENGKTAFVQFMVSDSDVAFGSTEFIVLRSRTLTPEYVYLLARSAEFRGNAIKSMTGATGRQRVQEACFDKFLITHPDERQLAAFTEVVKPMFKFIYCLAAKNANLRRTRNLLLPKLISGALDV